ncbi:MAG: tyrosine-type recombinase/integrase, partial [Prevotella sp.]|nr:tyrosine-type recombinase/integrase [Prevotella sp.]
YRLKIAQAVLYLKKLPDDFTQADVDDYLSMLLNRNRYTISHFKHTVFGLKKYYDNMGLKEPGGLVLPKVRKPKRLPRVLSQEQVKRLISLCDLYDKALLSTIYDCALRVSEACSRKWDDISFDRQQVFVYQGKGKKDRCVAISAQLLLLLRIFKKRFPSDDFVFKTHGRGVAPQPIKPGYVAVLVSIMSFLRLKEPSGTWRSAAPVPLKSSLPGISMSCSRCQTACILSLWLTRGSSTTACSRLHGPPLMHLLPRRDCSLA